MTRTTRWSASNGNGGKPKPRFFSARQRIVLSASYYYYCSDKGLYVNAKYGVASHYFWATSVQQAIALPRGIAIGRTLTLSWKGPKAESTRSLSNQNLHPFFFFFHSWTFTDRLQIDSDSHLFDHHLFLFRLHYSQACITQFTLHGISSQVWQRELLLILYRKFFSQAVNFCC